MNELDLYVLRWINLTNVMVGEEAICEIRYMYIWYKLSMYILKT